MKKTLLTLLCLACLSACPACAEWIDLHHATDDKEIKAVYLNTDIVNKGSYVEIWQKTIFRKPTKIKNKTFYEARDLLGFQFDKDGTVLKDKFVVIATYAYDTQGQKVFSIDNYNRVGRLVPESIIWRIAEVLDDILLQHKR